MKNLNKTIDAILRVSPELKPQLEKLKSRCIRWPHKVKDYWDELMRVLNDEISFGDPARDKISRILNPPREPSNELQTFEDLQTTDKLVGVIPENMADKIRRHDRKVISMAKKQVEFNMTRNADRFAELAHQNSLMEINQKKIWHELRDYFDLWDTPVQYVIRRRGPILVVAAQESQNIPMAGRKGQMIQMDAQEMRRIFKMLGIPPPPGLEDEQ